MGHLNFSHAGGGRVQTVYTPLKGRGGGRKGFSLS